jgi:hypothetical protein
MRLAYLTITIVTTLMNGYAAALNFVGAESVKVVADRVQVSRRWMVPLGTLLAAGAVGLLAGFAVSGLGIADPGRRPATLIDLFGRRRRCGWTGNHVTDTSPGTSGR